MKSAHWLLVEEASGRSSSVHRSYRGYDVRQLYSKHLGTLPGCQGALSKVAGHHIRGRNDVLMKSAHWLLVEVLETKEEKRFIMMRDDGTADVEPFIPVMINRFFQPFGIKEGVVRV